MEFAFFMIGLLSGFLSAIGVAYWFVMGLLPDLSEEDDEYV